MISSRLVFQDWKCIKTKRYSKMLKQIFIWGSLAFLSIILDGGTILYALGVTAIMVSFIGWATYDKENN